MTGHWFIDHLWLVPLLPFLGFLTIGLALWRLPPRAASTVAILAMACSALVGWGGAVQYFGNYPAHETLIPLQFNWLPFSPDLAGHVGVLVDDISMLLVVVVTTISLLIHIYSQGYMAGDPGYRRFFACMNLFTFAMLGLVLSTSILQIFVFWELVGVSSFLLIGYYWQRPSAVAACKKAFIVTRFADLGFLIGLLLLAFYAGGFDFSFLTSEATLTRLAGIRVPVIGISMLSLSAVLVYMGAAGKSAMFPLHIWLPDAMEGPTPVSALIHAATMVVAGVYLVARLFPLYAASHAAITVVLVVGTFTSLFAAIIATTQFDIKRVLAYSTLSQLGYMMLALGVSSWEHPLGFTAAMFHLSTHACFKALLFLGAGSIIHAVHTNDLREMGGLRKAMPVTHGTFLVGCLAIAGVPPFAGFFSKDEILAAAWNSGNYLVFFVAVGVAGLTAFYMFRLYFMTFWSETRKASHHAHESPLSMLFALVALAIPSIGAGFLPFGDFVSRGTLEHHGINWLIAGLALAVGLAGIVLAALMYFRVNDLSKRATYAIGPLYQVVFHKFYVDELYMFITHRIVFRYVSQPFNWFDRHCVDGFMDLTALSTRLGGRWLRRTVTGYLPTYLFWVVAGVLILCLPVGFLPGPAVVVLGGLGLLAVVGTVIWQFVLVMRRRTEPLKDINRD